MKLITQILYAVRQALLRAKRIGGQSTEFLSEAVESPERFFSGFYDALVDVLTSFWQLLRTPLRPLQSLFADIATPIQTVWQPLGRVFERSEWIIGNTTAAVSDVLLQLYRIAAWLVAATLGQLLQLILASPLGSLIKWLARQTIPEKVLRKLSDLDSPNEFLGFVSSSTSEFLSEWYYSRNFNALAYSTPAWLLGGVTLIPIVATVANSSNRTRHYRQILIEAVEAGDQEIVDIALQRLAQLDERRHERDVFRVALSDADKFGSLAAYPAMADLANAADGGLREAKLWIAEHILSGEIDQDSPRALARASELVEQCIAMRGEDDDTRRIMAELILQRDGLAAGMRALSTIASRQAWAQARLMRLYAANGDWISASRIGGVFIESHNRSLKNRQSISFEQHMIFLEALIYTRDWDGLVLAVNQTEAVYGEQPDRFAALGLYLDRYNPELSGALACALYRLNWQDERLNVFLGTELGRGDNDIAEFLSAQRDILRVDALAYRAAGDECYRAGYPDKALEHYLNVVRIEPSAAAGWNNIAWIQSELGDYDNALQSATRALDLQRQPNYYETRGQILARMSRWEEAIADLEHALNGVAVARDELANTHSTLATAYKAIGDPNLASVHAARAKLASTQASNL